MRLLIISHTPHYRDGDRLVGWGATVREIDHLASLFTSVVHVAPVHPERPPASSRPYEAPHVEVRAVAPAGGDDLRSKLGIFRQIPAYLRVMHQEMAWADVVHVRCPANLSLMAIVLLSLRCHPRARWIKYAGNWRPMGREPWSYGFQRWWLMRSWHGAQVTVNGRWPGMPAHVHSFLNPSFTQAEWEESRTMALAKELTFPVRLILVGRLESAKGVGRALRVLALIREAGVEATLDLVGDGPGRTDFERQVRDQGLQEHVVFHGWLPRTGLNPLYARSHFILLPSSTEGWPKVLSEAMAHGAVPVASDVSCIGHFLEEFQCGSVKQVEDVAGFRDVVVGLAEDPERWRGHSENAVAASGRFTYEEYVRSVRRLLETALGPGMSEFGAEAAESSDGGGRTTQAAPTMGASRTCRS